MRISRKAEYALRALAVIARQAKSWRIEEVSAAERIPVKFLEQILLTLRHAGILTSKRGVGGGYALARPAAEISVGEVIRALDGPVALVPCAAERPSEPCSCPDPRTCPVRALMTTLRQDFNAMLEGRSIEDLVRLGPGAESLAFDI